MLSRVCKFQISQFIIQVFLTGLLLGLFRSAVPALSSEEFGVGQDSYLLLVSFVIAFGIVKSFFNLQVGRWANQYGRKPMLVLGWVVAIPIPFLLYYADSWAYIVFATALLGVQQGLCWSISQISKLDITPVERHGLTMGINEFMGYSGVAIGGYLSAELVAIYTLQDTLLYSGIVIVILALILSTWLCAETKPAEITSQNTGTEDYKALFIEVSFTNTKTSAICFAGLIEKFIDVLVWIVFPVYLYRKGISLPLVGLITGAYALSWGLMQIITGLLSTKVALKYLINTGNILCGIGAIVIWMSDQTWWWFTLSVMIGIGMGLLYPSLGAAMSVLCNPSSRAPMMGIYRFWRDFGYAVGSLVIGVAAVWSHNLESLFVFVGISMLAIAVLIHYRYEDA